MDRQGISAYTFLLVTLDRKHWNVMRIMSVQGRGDGVIPFPVLSTVLNAEEGS